MYRVTVEKLLEPTQPDQDPVKVYEQTVDELDMRLVMQAVIHKPRKPREPRKAKS
jgi:hypothetical protein